MADTMTNDEIVAEFTELFGGSADTDEDQTDTPEEETETTDNEEETVDETTDEEQTEEPDDSGDEEEDASEDESEAQKETKLSSAPKPDKQAKQNHAFAELRNQNKQNEQFIRGLGKLVGLDNNASVDDIKNKIKEVLIAKEAKDNNISIELAKRLDAYESDKQELERVKLEKKVTEDFSQLIDKYNLSDDDVNDFTSYLIENGKNPMLDSSVDLDSEYLKLHFDDMIQNAVQEALAKEKARKEKVKDKAASPAPKGAGDKGDSKISTVKELDKFFDEIEL